MIAILKESDARKMYKYRKICAFNTFCDHDTYVDVEEGISLTYADSGVMPDRDDMNRIMSGDMSVKKFCKKVQKTINVLKGDYEEIAMNWACALNVSVASNKEDERVKVKGKKVNPEPVLLFVLPDLTGNAEVDREIKARSKVYIKYITTMLDFFGMKAIMRTKGKKDKKRVNEFLKLFKGDNYKKTVGKVIKYVGEHPEYMPTKQYKTISSALFAYYGVEIMAEGYLKLQKETLTKDDRQSMTNLVMDSIYCKNIATLHSCCAKNKAVVKMAKRLRRKNDIFIKSINQAVAILSDDEPNADITIPKKLKVGTKKNKKKHYAKLYKKIYKGDGNFEALVVALNVATYTIHSDETWGTQEYISGLRKYLASVIGKDFANKYCNILKAQLKEAATGA